MATKGIVIKLDVDAEELKARRDRYLAAPDDVEVQEAYVAALEEALGIRGQPMRDVSNKYMLTATFKSGRRALAFLNTAQLMQKIEMEDAPVMAAWLVTMSDCPRERFLEILDAVEAT